MSQNPVAFGKYQLMTRLAAGGMAEIYLARSKSIEGFEKYLVVKRMLAHRTADPDFVRMFLDEARLAATLDHPNIIQIHDVGQVDGEYFIAMEYLRGRNLVEVMRTSIGQGNARLPVELALSIIGPVCAGLHYAHEKRDLDGNALHIVHRDVTPHNIVVTFEGAVKLVDFGIARAVTREVETVAGTLKGKIGYMAPEQCKGEQVDRRLDIFALGVVLYETTVGRRLYQERSDFETLKRIIEGSVPDPREILPTYPAALADIVVRCLQKRPEDRYQTARDLLHALEGFAHEYHLATGTVALAQYMELLYGEELAQQQHSSNAAAFAAAQVSSGNTETSASFSAVSYRGESSSRSGSIVTPLATARREHMTTRALQMMVLALTLLVLGLVGGGYWWLKGQRNTTAAASPRATGTITQVAAAAVTRAPANTTAQPAAVPIEPGLPPRRPKPAAKPGDAHISVASNPRCEVLVDGAPYGATPLIDIAVPAGKHTVTLLNSAAGIRETQRVTLATNELWSRSYSWKGDVMSTSKGISAQLLAGGAPTPVAAQPEPAPTPAPPPPAAATAEPAPPPAVKVPTPTTAAADKGIAVATVSKTAPSPADSKPVPAAPAAPPAPVAARNVRAEMLEGQAISHPHPQLSPSTRLQLRGSSELSFSAKVCVGTDGKVYSVKVLRSIPGADNDIVDTIRRWTYRPQPTPVCFPFNREFVVQ